MILNNRIILNDNAVLKDLSVNLNNFKSGTENVVIIAAEDFIFIGGDLPFNHRWFEVSTSNANASVISVDLWDGNKWKPAVDILDQTIVTGASLGQSGHINWALNKNESWLRDDTIDNGETIPGLGDVASPITIYDLYWARISFNNDLSAGTALKFVGHKFADEVDLGVLYPELILANTKVQFEAGKTEWKDQEFAAARSVIKDLKSKKLIVSADQILNWQVFTEATIHRLAALIYRGFGDDWVDNRKSARDDYKDALSVAISNVDENRNARLDPFERTEPQGFLER